MTESSPLRLSLDVSAVPPRPAGAGRYTIDLAGELAKRDDLDIDFVARADDEDRWSALGHRVAAVAPTRRPVRLAWEQAMLPRVLSRLGVAVHHGPHYTMPERSRLPKVVTIHDLTFFDHPEWHERTKVPFFRRAIRVAARHADAIVCVSRTTAELLHARCSPLAAVHVAPHGVDLDRFCALAVDPAADQAHLDAFGIRAPYVLFVGTIEPRKDVPTLVRAFDRIAGVHADLRLVLAGGVGWGTGPVDAAIAQARHGSRIVRTGYVSDDAVPALLRQAAAVAYPALEEGFGLPALEALACGAPLVTTSGSAMEEVAGPAALLIEPGDADGLAGALDMLARGDVGLEARQRRGLEIAARHTWAASADGHVEAYRTLL
jgi:glycosyltransferase involved in cell wall biosynthesis